MAMVSWECGHCGKGVSAAPYTESGGRAVVQCPNCAEYSVRDSWGQFFLPQALNMTVLHLPTEVEAAWSEATKALSVGACTACEIMCRKILMHVAVDVAGSAPGETFVTYIGDLESKGYIVTGLKPKIDEIRSRGNIANHDLPSSTAEEAGRTAAVTRHLLVSAYELPNS